MLKYVLFTGLTIVLLAGCRSEMSPHLDDDFGDAVRHNVAVQTLNPDAGGPDGSASLDGPRVDQAVDRMRNRSNQAQNASLVQDVGGN